MWPNVKAAGTSVEAQQCAATKSAVGPGGGGGGLSAYSLSSSPPVRLVEARRVLRVPSAPERGRGQIFGVNAMAKEMSKKSAKVAKNAGADQGGRKAATARTTPAPPPSRKKAAPVLLSAATPRSRRARATRPCRPTSRRCRAGSETSGVASTRSSWPPSPTCTRPSSGTRPSMASRARAGSSTSTASRSTSRWRSSAARHCVLSRPAGPSRGTSATSTSTRTTSSTRPSSGLGAAGQPAAG